MSHGIGLLAALAAFWLLLSGLFTPLLLGAGAASVALVFALVRRMQLVDAEHPIRGARPRLALYWVWLLGQVLASALRVARLILVAPAAVRPVVAEVPNVSGGALAQTILANSITLTPGTLSVHVAPEAITVHALQADSVQQLQEGAMRRRVEAACR